MRQTYRNVLYNLVSQLLPMGVALVTLPILAHVAGAERLGFLGLAWSLIGYFSLFDLGFSRVVTRRTALADLHARLDAERRALRRLCVQFFVGSTVLSLLVAAVLPVSWVVGTSASPALFAEARVSMFILLMTIPSTIVTGLLRGSLEGLRAFGATSALRTVFGAASFAAPLVVVGMRSDLPALTASIACVRFASLFAHIVVARRQYAEHLGASTGAASSSEAAATPRFSTLLREGMWLTVSNVVGPLMVTFDRFVVAGLISLVAASHYFVPQETSLRLLVLPAAVATTLFPTFARLDAADPRRARLSEATLLAIAAATLLPCAVLVTLGHPLLTIWMGAAFADAAAPVTAIIAVGLFANCCAQAPFAWIQAAGRADVTGKLHLVQLPVFATMLVAACLSWGIVGAALAWSTRAVADFTMLFIASRRLYPEVALGASLGLIGLGLGILGVLGWITVQGAASAVVVALVGGAACVAVTVSMGIRLRRSTAA